MSTFPLKTEKKFIEYQMRGKCYDVLRGAGRRGGGLETKMSQKSLFVAQSENIIHGF